MMERLQRLLLLTVLFSLVAAGHLPSANYLKGGIWEATGQAEFAILLEEEAESESESHLDILQNDGSDDGGGGDDEIGLVQETSNDNKALGLVGSFDLHRVFNHEFSLHLLTKTQTEAQANSLASAYSPPLFLLFHNIKSDLPHPTA